MASDLADKTDEALEELFESGAEAIDGISDWSTMLAQKRVGQE